MDINLIKKNIMEKGYYIIKEYLSKEECNNVINYINSRNLHSLEFSNPNVTNSGGDYRSPNFHKYNQTAKKWYC